MSSRRLLTLVFGRMVDVTYAGVFLAYFGMCVVGYLMFGDSAKCVLLCVDSLRCLGCIFLACFAVCVVGYMIFSKTSEGVLLNLYLFQSSVSFFIFCTFFNPYLFLMSFLMFFFCSALGVCTGPIPIHVLWVT